MIEIMKKEKIAWVPVLARQIYRFDKIQTKYTVLKNTKCMQHEIVLIYTMCYEMLSKLRFLKILYKW